MTVPPPDSPSPTARSDVHETATLVRKRAPTLYGIIAFKLGKGAIFIALACLAYSVSGDNLPMDFTHFIRWLGLNAERKFFVDVAARISHITATNILWVASLMLVYGLFSFIEGVGLLLRFSWGAWMAIGESAFFVPIEIYELVFHRFTWKVCAILVINLIIFGYLVANRKRLFRHHYHAPA